MAQVEDEIALGQIFLDSMNDFVLYFRVSGRSSLTLLPRRMNEEPTGDLDILRMLDTTLDLRFQCRVVLAPHRIVGDDGKPRR